jgi:hypothetical protein
MNIRDHIQLMEIYQIVSEGILLEFDTESFLSRARGIKALIDRGGTEGEKAAAREAMKRFEIKANAEAENMSDATKKTFLQRFEAIKNGSGQSSAGMNREETGNWRKEAQEREKRQREREAREAAAAELRRKREEEQAKKDNAKKSEKSSKNSNKNYNNTSNNDYDEAPNAAGPQYKNITLYYFARLQDAENNHDKVYGVYYDSKRNEYFVCWGKYQGRLSTKMIDSLNDGEKIFQTKIKKGYRKMIVTDAVAGYVWQHLP